MIGKFQEYLLKDNKSENTIKGYIQSVSGFLNWFDESKGVEFKKLHRENVQDYISFLKTVKKSKPKTINTKINALMKFNEYLVESNVQESIVLTKKDYVKIQQQYASLAKVEYKDVEKFRQLILDSGSKRNYAIITLLAYAGLRISEALNLKMDDFNLTTRDLIVQEGKGNKTRTVIINDKVKTSIQAWKRERKEKGIENEYLFVSNRNKRIDRTTINKLFSKYKDEIGKEITPHDLRHFFVSHALNNGMKIHIVASQAGHSNIHTTMLYANPSRQDIIDQMNNL